MSSTLAAFLLLSVLTAPLYPQSSAVPRVQTSPDDYDRPVHVSSGEMAALIVDQPLPQCPYPKERPAGTLVLRVLISRLGTVTDVQVVSAPPSLRQCAVDAVRRWRYRPYVKDGMLREVQTTVAMDLLFGGPEPR